MKRILTTLFLAAFLGSVAHAVQVGDLQKEVVSALGKPVAARKKPDGSQIWKFKDGTTVWFTNGRVQKLAGPAVGNSISRDGVAVPVTREVAVSNAAPQVAKRVPVTTAAAATQAEEKNSKGAALQRIGYGVLIVGLLVMVISKAQFWLMVCRVSTGWLVGWLLAPLTSFMVATVTGSKSRDAWHR